LQQGVGNRAAGRFIQAKLKISHPSDMYEREADRVADAVLREPHPVAASSTVIGGQAQGVSLQRMRAPDGDGLHRPLELTRIPLSSTDNNVQRRCSSCEEENLEERTGEEQEVSLLQRRESSGAATSSATSMTTQSSAPRDGGQPLSESARAFFEPRFGYEFGQVRVHSDTRASESARDVNALAYTVGRDIVFGAGQYAPETTDGKRLLAHELAHVAQQGRSEPLVSGDGEARARVSADAPDGIYRQIVTQLNYANLADRLYEAMFGGFLGWGTDEEQVYLALQQLQRDQTAITLLETTYSQRHPAHDLVADIRDEFSGEELEYALQLINLGHGGAAQAIGAAPSTQQEFENSARRLRRAVEGLGTDEEAIYAVLLPLDRNMQLIHQLMRTYENLFDHENLRERIISEMSGSELDYALYLLGGPPVRANVEITEVTEGAADLLFAEMASLNVWTIADTLAPIPFHYPIDGCYARAQLMADRLTEMGYASEKVFAISRAGGAGLHVRSDYASDMRLPNEPFASNVRFPAGGPFANEPVCAGNETGQQSQPTVTWWYHVAPIIRVRDAQGRVEPHVLDPSMENGPVTVSVWTHQMRNEDFVPLRVNDILSLRAANADNFPAAPAITFNTDRDTFVPTGPYNADPSRAGANVEGTRGTMTLFYARAQFHDLAAQLRQQMRNPPINADLVVIALQNATSFARFGLRSCFPNLVTALRAAVSPPDVARVDVEINRP
jgi:hypothetical protein